MALSKESEALLNRFGQAAKQQEALLAKKRAVSGALMARGKGALEAADLADKYAQQEVGMTAEEKRAAEMPYLKELSKFDQKRIGEYGKLVKDAGTAQREALKKLLDVHGKVAAARSSTAAAKVREEGDIIAAELKQQDDIVKRSETASRETNNIARNIIKAASGETGEGGTRDPDEFGEVVAAKLQEILVKDRKAQQGNQPRLLAPGQRKHLVASLRPAMGERIRVPIGKIDNKILTRDELFDLSIQSDEGEDVEGAKERRQQILEGASSRLSRYGVGGSGIIKKAEAEMQTASEDYRNAVIKFQQEVPMDSLFGSTLYEELAVPNIAAIRAAPSKALPSVHLGRQLMEREDVREATGGDPAKLLTLMKEAQKGRAQARRLPFFGKAKRKPDRKSVV